MLVESSPSWFQVYKTTPMSPGGPTLPGLPGAPFSPFSPGSPLGDEDVNGGE